LSFFQMKLYYHDHFVLPLPEGHRFPMEKYALLRERLVNESNHAAYEFVIPERASVEELCLAHDPNYVARILRGAMSEKEMRRIGFPWTAQLVERSRRSVGGTISACRAALQDSASANLAGGTHHAYADHGEGYCVFNDSAVAARSVQAEGLARRIVILDCDVHQGNGTAAILANDPTIFTFSIHGEKNFPFHKEQSNLDIALPDGTGDDAYLAALQGGVRLSLEQARADLAIYLAGADPYLGDRLGRLSLSKKGLLERDRLVMQQCKEWGLPVALAMAGGYARRVEDTVDIHYQTITTLACLFA
jgi:acetoin utilization deacetylase AcuC-like enzyme